MLLALGCLGIGFLMLAHGLVTPGIGGRDYHAFLLAGFAATIYAVLTGYRRSRTLHDVLDGVFASDPMAHISRGYSETLRALIAAVEARDATPTGTRRAWPSCRSASACGWGYGRRPCAPSPKAPTCTTSARWASPTTSRNKPGALSDDERAWIQEHPIVGADIVGRARRRDALTVIRALTSDRAYRPAWPPDRALRHLEADRDGHFDPRCLDAFLTLMAERGHRPAGRPDELAPAGDSCHEQLPMPVRAPGGSDPGTGT